jgi:hypothetical protein
MMKKITYIALTGLMTSYFNGNKFIFIAQVLFIMALFNLVAEKFNNYSHFLLKKLKCKQDLLPSQQERGWG